MRDEGNDPQVNRNRREIIYAIRDELPMPPPTTIPPDHRNYNLWRDYHREYGDTLTQYRELKRILHQLAEEGKLGRFMNQKEYGTRSDNKRPYRPRYKSPKEEERKENSSNTRGVINMIIGGFFEDYPTLRAARDSVHSLLQKPPKAIAGGLVMKFDATISQPLQ